MTKDMNIFYRTADMEAPKFLYQTSPAKYPGLVAVMAQFLPTFESKGLQSRKTFSLEELYQHSTSAVCKK